MINGFYLTILLGLISSFAWSQVDDNTMNLTAEYGLSYHAVKGTDNDNGSSGNFTSKLGPYWRGTWSQRLSDKWGYRLSYKLQIVEFNDIEGDATIKQEEVVLNNLELGVSWMQTPIRRMTLFVRQRDHILYRAKDNDVFELIKHAFIEPGAEVAWGSRRRVGPQYNFSLQVYGLQPTPKGDIETGSGLGGEAALRLGWVTPLGVTVMAKGFYDYATSPNATLDFEHEEFGYALQMTYSF